VVDLVLDGGTSLGDLVFDVVDDVELHKHCE
jgi:hypothetical protein